MTRQTDHHDWEIPTEGETENWDEVLNAFFENGLDRDVVLSRPLAERPEPGETSPVLFFATDNQSFYYNDGSNWIEFLNTGYTDADARAAINSDIDHGSTAPHNYYTDTDAIGAIEGANTLTLTDDLSIDTPTDDDPAFTFYENGTAKYQLFADVSTDEFVLYNMISDTRVFEATNSGEFNLSVDELQVRGNAVSKGIDKSGSVTLSNGEATITTTVSSTTTATFQVALGPATDDAEIAASVVAVSGGNYEIHLDEINTSVGNPTVEYDVLRVR